MIRRLEWDSRHFDLNIGRVDGNTLSEAAAFEIAEERERFDCVYLLADADHVETAERAHQLGFRMVDVRITLAQTLSDTSGAVTGDSMMRAAVASDLPRLEALAATSYRSTRFYFDRRFEPSRVDEMYRVWIRNELNNPSAKVWAIDDAAGVVGYTSCTVKGSESEIGLVAVSEATRGTGKALALLARSLGWAAECGAKRMAVVTQARNVAALRLYERAGFRCQAVGIWYHLWRT
jgi:ribosomal protein S18 acetylase RimI-like enzyme